MLGIFYVFLSICYTDTNFTKRKNDMNAQKTNSNATVKPSVNAVTRTGKSGAKKSKNTKLFVGYTLTVAGLLLSIISLVNGYTFFIAPFISLIGLIIGSSVSSKVLMALGLSGVFVGVIPILFAIMAMLNS